MDSSDPLMASHSSVPSVVGRVEGSQGSLAVADPPGSFGQTNHKLQQRFGYKCYKYEYWEYNLQLMKHGTHINHKWAIVKTLGSRKGHPQIWEGPIAYHTFVQ